MSVLSDTTSSEPFDTPRREELLAGAKALFLRLGYRKTTLEDIGRACGLSKAAAYHYFPGGKRQIFEEEVRHESVRMLNAIHEAVGATRDPAEQMVAVLETRFRYLGDYLSETGVAVEMAELLPQAESIREEYFRQEAGVLQDILARGQREGLFRDIPGDDVPRLLISAVRGIELHFARTSSVDGIASGIPLLLGLLLDGLRRRP